MDFEILAAIGSPISYRFEGCPANLWIITLPITPKQNQEGYGNGDFRLLFSVVIMRRSFKIAKIPPDKLAKGYMRKQLLEKLYADKGKITAK